MATETTEVKKDSSNASEKKERSKKNDELNRHLRDLRAEILDLGDFAGKIKAGLTNIPVSEQYIHTTKENIGSLFEQIKKLNETVHSDTVRHIVNLWEQIRVIPVITNPAEKISQQEQLHALTLLEDRIGEMVLAIGLRTIPHRLNEWLGAARPGYFIPFHQLFESELPDPEGRERVLRTIALAPTQLNAGIVVQHSGLVYRYDPRRWARNTSLIAFILIFLGLTGMIWAVGSNCFLSEITTTLKTGFGMNLDNLFSHWVAILAGIVAHVVVSGSKRIREAGTPTAIAVNDWILLFSARKGDIAMKILLAVFALAATAIADTTLKMNAATVFFIGYSLDSFIGLFGESMDQKAAAQLATMRKKLNLS